MAVIDGKWLSKEGLTYFWSKIKAIFTKQTETNVIANLGAKNFLENTAAEGTQTIGGVSVTVNEDGSVDIGAGTVTGGNLDFNINMNAGSGMIAGENYIVSGCPQGGSASTYRINCSGYGYETGEGKEFTYRGGAFNVYIRVFSGQTISSPLHFTPMIRRAEITDDTFEPYAPSNRELYETRFGSKTVLPDNIDLDTIKQGGIYNGVNSTGNSAVHMPVPNGSFCFNLIVLETNEFIMQIFKKLNSEGDLSFYIRRLYIYNTSWDSWTMVSTDTMKLGKTLASGDSMDDLPVGRFTAVSATVAAGVTNAPWTGSGFFGWTIESVRKDDRFVQIAIRNDVALIIAKRRYTGTWTDWVYSGNTLLSVPGSILDYAASLPGGVYHAVQDATTGTGKPIEGKRYTYIIHKISDAVADILAIESSDRNAGRMYTCVRTGSTWGPWFKYEGTQV